MFAFFLTNKKSKKIKKIFSVFLLFVFIFVNFFGFSIPTAHAGDPWYNVNWAHRIQITIDHTKVSNTDQANFPVLISLTGLSNVNANGTDIRFTADDGATELPREIESYSAGTLQAWVKVPVLSASVDTVIFMYYGNSSATEPVASSTYGSQKVWDDGGSNYYKGVYHLPNGSTLSANDSTSNLRNGTKNGSPGAVAGQIDGAANFTASADNIGISTISFSGVPYTISAWFVTPLPNNSYCTLARGSYDHPVLVDPSLLLGVYDNLGATGFHSSGFSMGTLASGWHYLTAIGSGTSTSFYIDGAPVGSANFKSNNDVAYFGNWQGGGQAWGKTDEFRVSTTVRSVDWIKTEYNNQNLPSSFYSLVYQEQVPPPDAVTGLTAVPGNTQVALSWTTPFDGGSPITDYLIEYKLHINSSWSQFGHVASTLTTATIAGIGLLNGLNYDFRVSAVNVGGAGAASNIAQATPATVPSAVAKAIATRGNASASVAFTPFLNPVTGYSWYNNNWTYRQKITIDHTKVSNANQVNFPVLVSLTGLSNINTNGTDVRFTSDDGSTLLAREIESYSSGTLVAWVKVPLLSASVDTVIYMYYGNSGATEPVASTTYGAQKVWDDGGSNYFKAVWHLNNPATPTDSTSNLKDGTNHGATQATGKIGSGGAFTSSAYISQPVMLGSSGTVSFWLNSATLAGTSSGMYFGSSDDGSSSQIFSMQNWTDGNTYWGWLSNGVDKRVIASQAFPSGFFLVTLSWDTATGLTTLLWNGNQVGQTTGLSSVYTMAWAPHIMAYDNSTPFLFPAAGSIDEVRISSVARSADWIKTGYNNQNAPLSFYSVATQEAVSSQYSGSPITNYTVTSSPGGITATGLASPIVVNGLTNGTPYTFTIVATNSIGDSAASVASDPVTPATVPGSPTAVSPTYGDRQVSLLWSAPASNGGSAITDYVIEYKLTSASDIPANWQIAADPLTSVIISTAVTGLTNGTSYDFRITAINDVGAGIPSSPLVSSVPKTVPMAPTITSVLGSNAQVEVTFSLGTNIVPWYDNNWLYRKKITIDHTKVPNTNQTNFPVLISLTGLSSINANGTDIRFTDSTGTIELAREIESYSGGTLLAWVKVPTLSTSVNTDIYMYYGNAATTEPATSSTYGSQKVWDDGGSNYFKGVWHLPNGTTPSYVNSTGGNNATNNGSTATTGQIDGAIATNGTNQSLSAAINLSSTSLVTLEFWLKWDAFANDDKLVSEYTSNFNSNAGFLIDPNSGLPSHQFEIDVSTGAGGASSFNGGYFTRPSAGVWHHYAIVLNRNNSSTQGQVAYVDGVPQAITQLYSGIVSGNFSNSTLYMMSRGNASLFGAGSLDEYRISTINRTVDWIKTEYNNQSASASFYQVANEENVNSSITDGGSAVTAYTVTSSPGGFTGTGLTSPIIVSGLTNGTEYTFTVTATNIAGTGPASVASSPVTPASIPDAPTSIIATPGNYQVALSWTAPANNGAPITNYVIEYKLHTDSSWIQLGHAVSSTTTITVTDLINGSNYDFRVSAYNVIGTGAPSDPIISSIPRTVPSAPPIGVVTAGNASASVAFTILSDPDPIIIPWYNNNWAYRKKITIDHTKVPNTNQTNFPVLISLTGLSNINANGTDIRFTGSFGTSELAREIESYSSGTLVAWVKVPLLSTSIDTVIYMYYGNSGATEPVASSTYGSQKVWDDGGSNYFKAVWHLKETGANPTVYDSTASGFNSVSQTWTPSISGKVDGAGSFNGTGQAITMANVLNFGTGDRSFSFWMRPPNASMTATIIDKRQTVNPWQQYGLNIGTPLANGDLVASKKLSMFFINDTLLLDNINCASYYTTNDIVDGNWHFVSYTWASGVPKIYVDGISQPLTAVHTGTSVNTDTTYPFIIGSGGVYSGFLDQVEVSNIARSTDWVKTEFNNQNDPASFYALAPEENVGSITNNGGSAVTAYTVTSSPGGFTGTGLTSPIIVSGLTNGTEYTFTVTATNIAGTGPASVASSPVTPATVPIIPLNLATVVKSSSIDLTWSIPASNGGMAITDYVIEYKLTTGGSWVPFDDGVSVNTFATVTGLANGTSYDFRVSAKNIVGQGDPSSSASATPGEPAQVLIMGFPDLTNSSIGTDIRITNEGLIAYEYQYTWCVTDAVDNLCGGGNDIFSASNAKLINPAENYDFTAVSIVPNPGDYFFHIKVLYGSQSSSAFQSFTAVVTFPDPPTGVSATAGNAQATVSFSIPSSNGGSAITNYTVTSTPGGITGSGLTTPIIVSGLTNGISYTFVVTATNLVGTSLASDSSASVTPATVPDPPSTVLATPGNAQVDLSWTAPAVTGGFPITDYVIEYKLSSASSWSIFADAISTTTTVTVTGLTNNLSYDFRVSAVNSIGQSITEPSSPNTPAVPYTPPVTPVVISGGGGGGAGLLIVSQPPVSPVQPPVTVPPTTPPIGEVSVTPIPTITPIGTSQPSVTPTKKPGKNEVSATPTEVVPPKNETPTLPVVQAVANKALGINWIVIIISVVGAFAVIFFFYFFILRKKL